MRAIIWILIAVYGLMACSAPPPNARQTSAGSRAPAEAIVLPYSAFGPQVMAHTVIGFEWYQWNNVGECDAHAPADKVQVVVYRHVSREQVQDRYPVIAQRQDYRYLAYDDALAFLRAQIAEVSDEELPELALHLRSTQDRILEELGPQ
jgi:hypothetical protein